LKRSDRPICLQPRAVATVRRQAFDFIGAHGVARRQRLCRTPRAHIRAMPRRVVHFPSPYFREHPTSGPISIVRTATPQRRAALIDGP